jgi:hypothetical protein
MNEKPTRLFVVDRPTFSWEIAEDTAEKKVTLGSLRLVFSGVPVKLANLVE